MDAFLAQIPNRLFMEWLAYFLVKAELEEEAVRRAERHAEREIKRG